MNEWLCEAVNDVKRHELLQEEPGFDRPLQQNSLSIESVNWIFLIWLLDISEADQPLLWSICTLIKFRKVTEVNERLFCWRLMTPEGRVDQNCSTFPSLVALLTAHCQEEVARTWAQFYTSSVILLHLLADEKTRNSNKNVSCASCVNPLFF